MPTEEDFKDLYYLLLSLACSWISMLKDGSWLDCIKIIYFLVCLKKLYEENVHFHVLPKGGSLHSGPSGLLCLGTCIWLCRWPFACAMTFRTVEVKVLLYGEGISLSTYDGIIDYICSTPRFQFTLVTDEKTHWGNNQLYSL